jgi:hypothetical protein
MRNTRLSRHSLRQEPDVGSRDVVLLCTSHLIVLSSRLAIMSGLAARPLPSHGHYAWSFQIFLLPLSSWVRPRKCCILHDTKPLHLSTRHSSSHFLFSGRSLVKDLSTFLSQFLSLCSQILALSSLRSAAILSVLVTVLSQFWFCLLSDLPLSCLCSVTVLSQFWLCLLSILPLSCLCLVLVRSLSSRLSASFLSQFLSILSQFFSPFWLFLVSILAPFLSITPLATFFTPLWPLSCHSYDLVHLKL